MGDKRTNHSTQPRWWLAVAALVAVAACGNEPAVGIPVDDEEVPTVTRDVVPTILHDSQAGKPNQVDLNDTVSKEELTAKVIAYGELSPIDQKVITTITNTVEAPCEPCAGQTLASCLLKMPDGCENLVELRERTLQMIHAGAPPAKIRAALVYTDSWVPLPSPGDRPTDGAEGGMPLEVWVDPATSSVRAVTDTLDDLDLRGVRITFRIAPLSDDPVHRAWAAAAIAAESQGKLEAFLRASRKWRDEQRAIQGSLQLALTVDDLEVIITALVADGLDKERFLRERESPAVLQRIEQDRALSSTVGVRVAPSWFVDGYRLRGAQSAGAIQRVINLERLSYVEESASGLKGD